MKLDLSNLLLSLAIVATCACQQAPDRETDVKDSEPPNVFPARAAVILRNADTLQVLSLEPNRGETADFHGYPVIDTVVVEATARKAFVDAMVTGVAPTFEPKPCFFPHHGVHAAFKGDSVDLVICLLCDTTRVYYSDGAADGFSPSHSIGKILSDAFADLAGRQPD